MKLASIYVQSFNYSIWCSILCLKGNSALKIDSSIGKNIHNLHLGWRGMVLLEGVGLFEGVGVRYFLGVFLEGTSVIFGGF